MIAEKPAAKNGTPIGGSACVTSRVVPNAPKNVPHTKRTGRLSGGIPVPANWAGGVWASWPTPPPAPQFQQNASPCQDRAPQFGQNRDDDAPAPDAAGGAAVYAGVGGGSGAGTGRERGVGAGRASAGGGDWSGAGIDGPDLSLDSRIMTVGAFVGTPTTVAAWNTAPHSSHDVAPAETIARQFGHS